MEPEDFAGLSREEQLKVLEGKSWVKNIDFNQSFAELHSLTGGKKAKWKFQDSFYGNFNVGRRPSQDTAWGRRWEDFLTSMLMFYYHQSVRPVRDQHRDHQAQTQLPQHGHRQSAGGRLSGVRTVGRDIQPG